MAENATKPTGRRFLRFLPLGILAGILIVGLLLGWQRYFTLDYLAEVRTTIKTFAAEQGIVAILGYVLAYSVAVAVAFPATWLLTLIGGFLYGWLFGGVLAAVGATIGATALFWAARTAFGDWLRERAKGTASKVASGFEGNAFSYLLALRLLPILPFALVNIVPALFKIPTRIYVAATFLGILPGVFVYAYLGQGIEGALSLAAESGRTVGLGDLVTPEITLGLLGLALLACVAPVYKFIRSRRQPAG
ncbi:VTT domain-containing protein [Devosia rhodophyticola]|uniref:TVP38/TMEM64 family membrane protein n=1 Tax=Devosia rhodophyticola TaxID=3026423 RepID=A0ABY7YYJ3_9HYPH|nr:VTT domain-containing protein [Devosia rhodophyticola]WDR06302.1 VTT domain-containing protein [Devosia rhodophyticola]